GSNSYSLAAYDDAGSIAIRLTQTAGVSSGFSPWSESFTAAEPVITLSVGGGALAQAAQQDSITIDLASFQTHLDPLLGAGDWLSIEFTGGYQDLLGDQLILDGSAVLDFGLRIDTDADLLVSSSVDLTAENIDLRVSRSGTGLPPDLGVTQDFLALASVDLDVNGRLTATQDVRLTALSDLQLTNDSLGLGGFQLAFIGVDASAEIDIGDGAQITAAATMTATARSHVQAVASLGALAGKSDTDTDAAVASVVVSNDAAVRVGGDAVIDVTGALQLEADNRVVGIAHADGTPAGGGSSAGATLGLAVVTGTTEASIRGDAQVSAGSIRVAALTQNTLSALAQASEGGATDGGISAGGTPNNESQKALKDQDAATATDDLTLAGAVAVGVLSSSTEAMVDSLGTVTSGGLLDIEARQVAVAQTQSDGSATVIGSGNSDAVGIAASVAADVVHARAWVGGAGATAGALQVHALAGQRSLDFAAADIDDAENKLTLALGGHGLRTGDAVNYAQGSASAAIGGLNE
ncbi:MAG: hypothetical protein OEW36_14795, partial [Hylemonella sp.]|nr:hypothetical protein [Hylemonella sp.]